MNRKSTLKPQDIVVLATNQHLSPSQIAKLAGVSRQQVWKTLKKAGVSTHKGPGGLTWVECRCNFCGKTFEIRRCRWRQSIEHFCSNECYYASRENPNYYQWRHGTRLARVVIAQYFPIQPDHVVHHIDGDDRNNDRSNLMVFANHSDHLKYHHGENHVVPLWDGSQLV